MQILKQNLNTNTIIKRQFLVKIKEIKMNRITINGKTIICSGTNVVISNGKVISSVSPYAFFIRCKHIITSDLL